MRCELDTSVPYSGTKRVIDCTLTLVALVIQQEMKEQIIRAVSKLHK